MGKSKRSYLQHKNNKNMKKIQKKKRERKFIGMLEHLVNSGVISFDSYSSADVKTGLRELTSSINQDYRDNLPNLNDYTYETRPAMLSFMTKEAFESIRKTCPYFYQDEEGEVHFVSEWSAS